MRTIKYRGKRLTNSNWIYGGCYTWFPQGTTPTGKPLPVRANIKTIYYDFRVWPATVGQFTGLFDKRGKEIYEGDLLRFREDKTGVIEVRFVRGVFAFLWNGNLDDEMPINAPTHEWAEVIGNIHDNPELLKGGAK